MGYTGAQNHDAQTFYQSEFELTDHLHAATDTVARDRSRKSSNDHPDTGDVHKSSHQDVNDMHRMGKQQILVRRFRQITIAAFIGTTTCAWEYALFLISPGLIDGGTAGLLYNVLWSFFGFGAIYLSLAEMASMAPIAGSLYHWVSEFAPEEVQGILSYITGWTSTVAWQAGYAQGIILSGTQIQTIILLMDENYAFPAWHGTLLAFAAILVSYVINVYGVRSLPYWQIPVFAIGTMAYLAYMVPVWISAPKASHTEVWTGFSNTGGWSSMTLAVLVGQLSGISMQTGVDTAAHMAEEVKDAAVAVPRAMMTIFLVDFALIFPLIVTICYHLPDVEAALEDTTTYPGIWVLRQAMSRGWIAALLAVMTFMVMASNTTYLAGVSRDLFAFARDRGLPFSDWLSKVDDKRKIPRNANIFSSAVSALLALIYIGSDVAFYAITSLNTVSLLQCYVFAIGCVLWR